EAFKAALKEAVARIIERGNGMKDRVIERRGRRHAPAAPPPQEEQQYGADFNYCGDAQHAHRGASQPGRAGLVECLERKRLLTQAHAMPKRDRRHHRKGYRSESTRLNSSHVKISYAVFCL